MNNLSINASKRQSKQQLLADLLIRDSSATLDEMVSATGWLPHTTRAALTGLKKKGYALSSDKVDGARRDGLPETFHAFTGKADRRIDWVLTRGFRAKSARTLTTNRGGRYPSDHFPWWRRSLGRRGTDPICAGRRRTGSPARRRRPSGA